jgi:hypothetical protein
MSGLHLFTVAPNKALQLHGGFTDSDPELQKSILCKYY